MRKYQEPNMPENLRRILGEDSGSTSRNTNQPDRRNARKLKNRTAQRNSSNYYEEAYYYTEYNNTPSRRSNRRVQEPRNERPTGVFPKSKKKTAESSYRDNRKKTVKKAEQPILKKHSEKMKPSKSKNSISAKKVDKNKILKTKNRTASKKKKSTTKKNFARKNKNILKTVLGVIVLGIITFINFLKDGGDKKKWLSKEKSLKMDRQFHKIFSVVFMLGIIFMSVVIIVHPDEKKSIAENRDLASKPAFTVGSFIDGKYTKDYSTYIADQFPDRSGFIKIKAKFDRFMGKDEINGVYICKDGYLMEGFEPASEDVTKQKIDAINKFANSNPKLNVALMLVPNKVSIYKGLLPKHAPVGSQKEYSEYVEKNLNKNIKYVKLFDELEREKNSDMNIFFKTDHHWTPYGAFLAYSKYCKDINNDIVASKGSLTPSLASNTFLGSLYYKNGAQIGNKEKFYLYIDEDDPPITVKYFDKKKKVASLYDASKLSPESRDQYEVFTGGNHPQIKIRTAVNTKRKLLVIKDSYANAMLPFLSKSYSEIQVIDPRYFTGSIKNDVLENNIITDVLILQNINTFNTDSSILTIND